MITLRGRFSIHSGTGFLRENFASNALVTDACKSAVMQQKFDFERTAGKVVTTT